MELTLRELKTVGSFLRQAHVLIVHVSFLVFNAGDSKTAARLNDITARLTDEIEGIERRIETDDFMSERSGVTFSAVFIGNSAFLDGD